MGTLRRKAVASLVLLGAASAWAVEMGDPAPPLTVKTWVQGEPVKIAEAGDRLVLVEWFATRDKDSQATVPRLNRLRRLHGDRLDIVVVTDEDEDVVRKFLATTPLRTRVALDQDTTTKQAWMQHIVTQPYAFIVREGTVVWRGSPARGLYPAVADLLADRYSADRYKRLNELYFELTHALKAHKTEEVLGFLDQMMAAVPEDAWAYRLKVNILRKQGRPRAAREVYLAMGKLCASDPDALAEAAQRLGTANGLFLRAMPEALGFARQAVELTKRKEADILAVLARCHYELAHLDKAIEIQTEALAVATGAEKRIIEPTLAFYRAERERRAADPEAQ